MILDIITGEEISKDDAKKMAKNSFYELINEKTKHHSFRYILVKNSHLITQIIDNNGKIYNIYKPKSLEHYGINMKGKNRQEVIGRVLRDCSLSGKLDGLTFKKLYPNEEKVRNFIKKHAPEKSILKERGKVQRAKHFKKRQIRIKNWKTNNKEHVRSYNRKYFNERGKNDLNFKIKRNLRNRLRQALKSNSKNSTTIILLGCSVQELKNYLESKFTNGMSWDNYGKGGEKWQIDHIIPCSFFDLTIEENQRKCFHYTNLQPLWEKDNLKKGRLLNYNHQIL